MKYSYISFTGRTKYGNSSRITDIITSYVNSQDNEINNIILNEQTYNGCNKCEYECFTSINDCPYSDDAIKDVYSNLLASDIIFYVIPNYSGWPCSNYFVFNERSQSFFDDSNYNKYINIRKCFIVLSNTDPKNIINVIKSDFRDVDDNDIYVVRSRDYGQSSISGMLIDNVDFTKNITLFLDSLSL